MTVRDSAVQQSGGTEVEVSGGASNVVLYNNDVYEDDVYEDDVYGDAYSGITDPTGTSGNISLPAKFTNTSGSVLTWVLTPMGDSPLVNAGSSGETDGDGSPNDIGAYGGSRGDDW